MKYLKSYPIFEAQTSEHWEVHDILLDLFEEYGYEVPEFVHKFPSLHDIQAASRWGSIHISDYWVFDAKCLRIRIGDYNGRLLKSGAYKDFNGFMKLVLINTKHYYKKLIKELYNF